MARTKKPRNNKRGNGRPFGFPSGLWNTMEPDWRCVWFDTIGGVQ